MSAVERFLPELIVPWHRAQGAFAVDEDVVLRADVVPAVGEDRAEGSAAGIAAAQEDVAEHQIAAVAVVKINRAGAVTGEAADVGEEIVPDDVPTAGRVAALVDRSGVIGFADDVADDVQLKHVII